MKIEWLPIAQRDRRHQLDFIGADNPRAASDLGDAIEAVQVSLANHPRMGRVGRIKGTRELVMAGTPYIVAYRIETDAIVIVRFLHGAQQWPDKPKNTPPS